MSRKLNLASLLLIPSIGTGCAFKQPDRAQLKKNEVICGPQITANYTVPQWGVLPATSAACCLPMGQGESHYEEYQSIVAPSIIPGIDAQPHDGADSQPSLPERSQSEGNVKKPAILAPGLIEQPIAQAIELPQPPPTGSPSDVNRNSDALPYQPPNEFIAPSANQPQPDPLIELPQIKPPQMDLPAERQLPQAQNWNESNLPTVPTSYQAEK